MSRLVSRAILITFWLATLSCSSAPNLETSSSNICKGGRQTEHPPEDAQLVLEHQHMSESLVESVYLHDDATVCISKHKPKFASLFAVRFEPGSATLDPSEMPPGSCESSDDSLTESQTAACRRRVELEFDIDKARASSAFQTPIMTVNGYAWPWETECEAEAVELSRRRAEVVADWLRSQEQYDLSLKISANGTQSTRAPGGGSRVIGVDLGPQPLVLTATGPPLDEKMLSRLGQVVSDYVEAEGERPRKHRLRTGEDALIDWLHQLLEEGCNPLEVPPRGGLLDVALERYE